MKTTRAWLLALTVCALALPALAQDVGGKIPLIELRGFGQTKAKSFDEYTGRAVLLEFFAYW